MAFQRPNLSAIIDRVQGDIKSALGIGSILRRSFLAAIARAIAGAAHILHSHLVFVSRQIFPDQAEAEYLERWGSIYGLERQPATFAELTIDVVFTGAGTVPAGTIYQRSDGFTYTVDADIDALAAGTVQGLIVADEPGATGNLDIGNLVSLQSPIVNVQTDATVSAIAVDGEDVETDESYRQRIVDRIQEPPAGGAVHDYIAWARSVSGVTRAWVFPGWLGQGTVGVSFVEDEQDPIIPIPAKVDEVQTYIDTVKPVTANVTVFQPTAYPLNITIALKPNTAAVRAAVETELQDLIAREAQMRGAVIDPGAGTTYDGKIPLSRVNEAISLAAGEEDHVVTSPVVDPQALAPGGIVTLGTITFQTLV